MSSEWLAGAWKARWARVLGIAAALTVIILAALIVPIWLRATVPQRVVRRTVQTLLLAAQPAYGATLAITFAGLVVLGTVVLRARRRGESRLLVSRMLLLFASGLVAIVVAEGAAAVWTARLHRHPPLPAMPTRFDNQHQGDVNVVVIGGSAAYGLPFEKWLSTGRIVASKLGEAIPDRQFRLDVLAESGVHLERMHQKLAEYPRRPDLLIIFSGHNEFTYRYRWSRSVDHYFDEIPSRPRKLIGALARRCSPLCAMIQEAIEANGLGEPPPPEVTRELVDVPAVTSEEYAARLDDFRRRLEAIVVHCERMGTLAVLLIPPSNDSGFEPNRSSLPPGTSRASRDEFTRRFLAVRASEKADPALAAESYRALLADQPGFAETHFRLARLLERSGDRGEADRHYRAARDLDGLPMRCPGEFQDVYREVAARYPKAILIDGQAALAAASPDGILGDSLFLDAMHPTVRGHALLARAILDGLRARGAFGWPEGTPTPEVDPAECVVRFGLGTEGWKVACEWGTTFFERTAHIRYDPSERLAWITRYRRAASAIAEGRDPEDVGLPGIGVRPVASPGDRLQTSIGPKRASGR
jgi:hypothetical protein